MFWGAQKNQRKKQMMQFQVYSKWAQVLRYNALLNRDLYYVAIFSDSTMM